MKVPAVGMVTAFAAGLLLSRPAILPQGGARRTAVFLLAGLTLGAISAGLILLRKYLVSLAAVASLLAWILAGALAGLLAQLPLPANHVTALLSTARLDTNQPLRWRARLREDPKQLPWGHQYDLDLEKVEISGPSGAGTRATPRTTRFPFPGAARCARRLASHASGRPRVYQPRCCRRVSTNRRIPRAGNCRFARGCAGGFSPVGGKARETHAVRDDVTHSGHPRLLCRRGRRPPSDFPRRIDGPHRSCGTFVLPPGRVAEHRGAGSGPIADSASHGAL